MRLPHAGRNVASDAGRSLFRALPRFLADALTCACLAGCAGLPPLGSTSAPLDLDIAAKVEPGQGIQTQRPVVLRIAKYVDARPGAASKTIGDVKSTILDMHTARLEVQDLPGTVTAAMLNQFSAIGFQAVVDDTANAAHADFVLSGVIKDFRMNVAGRDEVSIEIETTLGDARGAVLWSGVVVEKADRFAGVAGNTRNSITRYLSAALGKVSAKTREAASGSIVKTYPDLFVKAAPAGGVTVLNEPVRRATAPQPARPSGMGLLEITTIPSRAKVYIADVYYGLSPLRLSLEPGIYPLHFKLEAFKAATEKVSVRKDETTEIEIRFER